MNYHCYYHYTCPRCGEAFVPYAEGVVCPQCGEPTAEVYDIVGEIIWAVKYHLGLYGELKLRYFQVTGIGDQYLFLGFTELDSFRRNVDVDIPTRVQKALARLKFVRTEAWRKHYEGFFTLLFQRWREERYLP
ncbi:MAG TPA: hypothetical protein EYP85_00590 [Armatimonadetes bacterium]|nr:hypothetical protein [Armatimonadota bacterium]